MASASSTFLVCSLKSAFWHAARRVAFAQSGSFGGLRIPAAHKSSNHLNVGQDTWQLACNIPIRVIKACYAKVPYKKC
eukprot:scaffold556354_cov22-Prasinocladus_malaysianus.AAC.1